MKVAYTLLIITAYLIPVQASAMEKLSVSELLDRYTANQDKLKSFIAKMEKSYRIRWHHKEQTDFGRLTSELRVDGKRIHLLHYNWDNLFSMDANTPIEDAGFWADLWDGKCSILYDKIISTDKKSAIVSTEERLVRHNTVVWCAGLPILGIRHSSYEPIDSVLRQADSISVRNELEPVGLVACYVIDANTTTGRYTVWFDPQHGYQIAQAEIHTGPDNIFRGRLRKEVESYFLSVRNIRFENVDGV